MRFALVAFSALIAFAYPFAVYFGIGRYGLQLIGLLMIAALLLRLFFAKGNKIRELQYVATLSAILGVTLIFLGMLFKQLGWLLFYPVAVNLCLLCLFAYSLKQPQTIIERFARLQDPNLSQSAIAYTRKVTLVWCGFFVINAAIAFYTLFQPLYLWTLYNGFVSYLLIGALFIAEWIVRQRVRKKQELAK